MPRRSRKQLPNATVVASFRALPNTDEIVRAAMDVFIHLARPARTKAKLPYSARVPGGITLIFPGMGDPEQDMRGFATATQSPGQPRVRRAYFDGQYIGQTVLKIILEGTIETGPRPINAEFSDGPWIAPLLAYWKAHCPKDL